MPSYDLSGTWLYKLDPNDVGDSESWFVNFNEDGELKFPGTLSINKIGEPQLFTDEFNEENLHCLRDNYKYLGAVWLKRKVFIDQKVDNAKYKIIFERLNYNSKLWINGNFVGNTISLCVPHQYDVSQLLVAGQHNEICVCIDNRDTQELGILASAYTDDTQTMWNGIVGDLLIKVCDERKVERPKISIDNDRDVVEFTHILPPKAEFPIEVSIDELDINHTFEESSVIDNKIKIYIPLSCFTQWNEFNPKQYEYRIVTPLQADTHQIAVRQIKTDSDGVHIGGKHIFLRGTLDCCIYPLTGHPPCDVESWKRVMKTVKDYGLNHIRFHSWCPPEAAYLAANELGVYLNIEGPIWLDYCMNRIVGSFPQHRDFIKSEAQRILKEYGHHPSFCFFANGNELRGDFSILRDAIAPLKIEYPNILFTLTSNWDRDIESYDDFFTSQSVGGVGVRGQYFLEDLVRGTKLEFSQGSSNSPVPVVSHEVGQYLVYPDMAEIDDYTGVLNPINLKIIKKDLVEKKLISHAEEYKLGSGQLAKMLYKDEIEAALRTPNFGGIQLLDLHDYPGQGTATIGMLNAFWKSKGIVSGTDFREFCNDVVPLLELEKRIYKSGDSLSFTPLISNYSNRKLDKVKAVIKIYQRDKLIESVPLFVNEIKQGQLYRFEDYTVTLKNCSSTSPVELSFEVEGTEYKNRWMIWVLPKAANLSCCELVNNKKVFVFNTFNELVIKKLEQGEDVLIVPDVNCLTSPKPGTFFPVFWSPICFSSEDSLGLIIDHESDMLSMFPTEKYINYQWKSLLEDSVNIDYSSMGVTFKPIIDVIPNYLHNAARTNLFEANVLNGRVIFAGFDFFDELNTDPVASCLLSSILSYMESPNFEPGNHLTKEQMLTLFKESISSNHDNDLAYRKPAIADCYRDQSTLPHKAVDGKCITGWFASEYEAGHWWRVDLGKVSTISEIEIEFNHDALYEYTIAGSVDGIDFKNIHQLVNPEVSFRTQNHSICGEWRYIRITYDRRMGSIAAGHRAFRVFG
ncbi:sugar-binding domain-containing protein [Photobacterium sp. DNB23_23_1]|uniref:beta-galactosidase n=1 Tax=Photobacterium pectinilyticum TaxID=2906793 RepID=A0ABT1N060_9GAMM|nr:sugar-binding domain-containing protein [Photobacterium sp. ZSDE20]MCQ1058110.1 discoidin domain-containing protein [Photobacterium sp. ZSDE20]MDD1822643.1 discoidin domain-containing protein [Photobacterium sp. ZSDE20]